MKTILIADDEPGVRLSLQAVLGKEYRVVEAKDGEEALALAEKESPDIAIIDLRMPKLSGQDLLPQLKTLDPQLPVIILSASKDVSNVFQAVKAGASYYLTKPFDVQELRLVVELAGRAHDKEVEIAALESQIGRLYDPDSIIGDSPEWRQAIKVARLAAKANDTCVLLTGETGTGKELVARLIHQLSHRQAGPLVPIHCAAIPESLFESELFGYERGSFTGANERRRGCIEMANGGTLFLDEIGEMPLSMQTKLLRFLQDKQFMRLGGRVVHQADVRIVAATNRNLALGTEAGWFRRDLYYRLNTLPVQLPPLRERLADVPVLARHFLTYFRRHHGAKLQDLLPETVKCLTQYNWPGNVREMRSVIERAAILHGDAELLLPAHLPAEIRQDAKPTPAPQMELPICLDEAVAKLEKEWIAKAVNQANGNLSQAAILLQTTRRKLAYKMEAYNMQ